jgi:hypothetical protein
LGSCRRLADKRRRPLSRLEQLKRIEDGLGDLIERCFASDSTFVFAAGRTTVNFAQVPLEPTPSRAVMFAELHPDSGTPVALCLFGSMDNFSEFLRNAKAPLEAGWTNSSLPAIIKCVAARCTDLSAEFSSRHGFAIEALKVATREGVFATVAAHETAVPGIEPLRLVTFPRLPTGLLRSISMST